jgi:enamine deaminase RidA (YjgF/YER057c/UK114 family)
VTHPDEKLKELGIEIKEAKAFHPAVAIGVITDANLLYVSGSTSPSYIGRVGDTVSIEDGYQAAREAAIAQIAAAKTVLGDLGRIRRVVKVLGMVNAAPGFKDTPAVIHGASELYTPARLSDSRPSRATSQLKSRRSSRSNRRRTTSTARVSTPVAGPFMGLL